MTERLKIMGRIEWALGAMFGVLVGAYVAGLPIPEGAIIVTGMFLVAYFGHWAFSLVQVNLENQNLLLRLREEQKWALEREKLTIGTSGISKTSLTEPTK